MRRGTSRFPPNQFRLKSEDLLREVDTQQVKPDVVDNTFALGLEDYQANMQIRNKQYEESKKFDPTEEEEEEDEYENPAEPTTRMVTKF